MIRSKYNINFLPEDFQIYILNKIQSEGISFRISSPRKSKLGDYKYIYSNITKKILICDNSSWSEHMENSNKKDDLADCLLQGLWYILDNNMATTNYNELT